MVAAVAAVPAVGVAAHLARGARKGGKEFGMAHGGLSWSVFRYI
ncbi:hypothetical protein WJ968_29105 [Achromobacter xylosoxidans]